MLVTNGVKKDDNNLISGAIIVAAGMDFYNIRAMRGL